MHDDEELERALEASTPTDRDQQPRSADFSVDVERTSSCSPTPGRYGGRLASRGIASREQLRELERVGVDAVLVGEILMRSPDPSALCRELTGGEGGALSASQTH